MKLSELKVGDRFSCEFTVIHLQGNQLVEAKRGVNETNLFDLKEDTEVILLPPKIKVGDRVHFPHSLNNSTREVLAIKEGLYILWISETKSSYTVPLDQLVICNQEGTSK